MLYSPLPLPDQGDIDLRKYQAVEHFPEQWSCCSADLVRRACVSVPLGSGAAIQNDVSVS